MTRLRPIGAPGDLIEGIEFSGRAARQKNAAGLRGGVVESVEPGSPAERARVGIGDVITSVNGNRLRDVIDYQFYAAGALVFMDVHSRDDPHRKRRVEILKDEGQSLGITFTQPTFAPIRECNNHCPFCFIDQLPGEMRSSLYIRDDDYRYSFLFGNFVTLTNLNERDWQRLEEQRLSPLYVSVHATDPKLRRILLGNNRAPDILNQLERLAGFGIRVHTQVVVCPGMNDGAALDQTVNDLAGLFPHVISIGVVPVGLTRTPEEILAGPGASCSRILPSAVDLGLRTMNETEAKQIVGQAARWQKEFRRLHGQSLVFASDEIYLLANERVPSARSYDGYPQYENGIGMVRDLLDDWTATKRRLKGARRRAVSMSVVCGEMIAPVLQPMVREWCDLTGNAGKVVPIANSFFGSRVRVSGLLTGRDIIANRSLLTGDMVVLPKVMLDKTGAKLLDNLTPSDLANELGKPVRVAGMMSELNVLFG